MPRKERVQESQKRSQMISFVRSILFAGTDETSLMLNIILISPVGLIAK